VVSESSGFQRRWENRRAGARTAGDEARESYYGLPVIHKPHWDWWIIVYFFVGGICGAANAIATLARWHGGKEGESISRIARYLSFAMVIPSTVCLILDLGRPERFLNMLRIVKLRSPMSMGTWILLSSSFFLSLLTVDQARRDGLLGTSNPLVRMLHWMPVRLIDALGVVPSLMLAGYTGVLLAATAVPLWTRNYLVMGPLFLASAFSNAAAAITLILGLRRNSSDEARHRMERLDLLAMFAEVGLLILFKRGLTRTVSEPLETGQTGKLHRYGVLGVGIGLPLLLHGKSIIGRSSSGRTVSVLASALVLIGGLAFRYVMVMAGHRSADDPKATFEMTRNRR
jgi:formate-dependent nitrite reductase membrane component NrfD